MHINPKKINLLKEPFGILIKEQDITKDNLQGFVHNAIKIATVGDTTTQKFVNFGFIPNISVVDGKEKRKETEKIIEYPVENKVHFENKHGEINEEIINLIKKLTFKKFEKIQIIINGEEDLIALPLFMYLSDKWTVFYGQPNEGMVVVEINEKSREKAKLIFSQVIIN